MGVATQEEVDALFNIGGRRLKGNEYIGAIDEVMGRNITSLLDRLGVSLVDKLQLNAPSSSGRLGDLISVIGVRTTKYGYRLEIGFGTEYHDYIDKGVKGLSPDAKHPRRQIKNSDGRLYTFKNYGMPPAALEGLKSWAKMKNIEIEASNIIDATENKKGKKKRTQKKINTGASRLAYYIKKYGLDARNYKAKSIKEVTKQYKVELDTIGYNSLILNISK